MEQPRFTQKKYYYNANEVPQYSPLTVTSGSVSYTIRSRFRMRKSECCSSPIGITAFLCSDYIIVPFGRNVNSFFRKHKVFLKMLF